MIKTEKFEKRIGKVFLPLPEDVPLETPPALTPDPSSPGGTFPIDPRLRKRIPATFRPPFERPFPPPFHLCSTSLTEGCYTLAFMPGSRPAPFWRGYRGTLRVEHRPAGIRFSGDLYSRKWNIITPLFPLERIERIRQTRFLDLDEDLVALAPGVIPIYSRESYYSYLKGVSASLFTLYGTDPCTFSLTVDEFRYQHPATGFSGSFPAAPNRRLRFVFEHTATPDFYTGRAYEGAVEAGTVSMRWVSPSFRRASLVIHRLQGAVQPAPVAGSGGGIEDFHTIFATTGWDLSVTDGGEIPLPAGLVGVQDPNTCWSKENSATLMESVPGYNPAILDTVWQAHLLAIPATLGCSRGRMFDNGSGDPNNVPREGAVTHSHDGYPLSDSANFGAAQDGMQKDFPRGFLRSAAHEAGHAFNQIHQEFEGGSDNSIMTTTPSVADVLAAAGQTFPNDINLSFIPPGVANPTVRRHLVHLPDPAVRPGGMEFFGAAVTAPEADQVEWPAELDLSLFATDETLALGEPLILNWILTNRGAAPMPVPTSIDIDSLTARVSVTDPDGNVTFLRPYGQEACPQNPVTSLPAKETLTGSATVFWGRDGFTFQRPGRHTVEVILLWQVSGVYLGASAETQVWVDYPGSEQDNRIAALLLDPDVGRAVASGVVHPKSRAEERIAEARKVMSGHRAIGKLNNLKLVKEPRRKK
jgi:hypothetical protein